MPAFQHTADWPFCSVLHARAALLLLLSPQAWLLHLALSRPRAGNAEQLREIESKQRDLEEQERQVRCWAHGRLKADGALGRGLQAKA